MAKGHLWAEADKYADDLKSNRGTLRDELAELEKLKSKVRALIAAADIADDRSEEYGHFPDTKPLCPRCWMHYGEKQPLRQIDDPTHWAAYRCKECKQTYRFLPKEAS
jgi:hypothetical protein